MTLMTLHSAKGLEFPVVFLPGLEDGLLPHFNTQGRPEDVEEERRLFYVGMTRAQDRLLLSACRRRRIAGRYQDQLPSPFPAEVPECLVEAEESPTLFASERVRGSRLVLRPRAARRVLPGGTGARPQVAKGIHANP